MVYIELREYRISRNLYGYLELITDESQAREYTMIYSFNGIVRELTFSASDDKEAITAAKMMILPGSEVNLVELVEGDREISL